MLRNQLLGIAGRSAGSSHPHGLTQQEQQQLVQQLLKAEVAALKSLASGQEGGTAGGEAPSGVSEEATGTLIPRLEALSNVLVTADLLAKTGAGRELVVLKKHSNPKVANAAAAAVSSWKAQVKVQQQGAGSEAS